MPAIKNTTNKALTPVIVLALVIFVALVIITSRQTRHANTAAAWVAHTQEVLFQTEKILSVVTEIETSSRAFLLTGQQSFFETYKISRKAIPEAYSKLKLLTADNLSQQLRIDSLVFYVNQRIAFADSIVRVKKDIPLQTALQIVLTGRGKLYLDNIRHVAGQMQDEENRLLEQRKKDNAAAIGNEQKILLAIAFIMLVLLIAVFWKEKQWIEQNAQKKTEDTLKKSEENFRLLVSNVKDHAIFMLDTNGMVASWNSGAAHIKGYTEKEIIGKSFEVFYNEEDIKNGEPRHNLEMTKEYGHYEKEGWRLRKNGTSFWANIVFTALKDKAGNLYGYSKITRDITERKKTQEQLELLSRQINQSNDSIYTTDAGRKITSWNRGAEKIYGFTKEEALGKDSNELLQTVITEQELNDALKKVAKQDYWTDELKRTTKAGAAIWVRSSLTNIKDEKGEITGHIAVSFDITDRKKAEEKLKEFEHFFNNSNDLSCIANTEGHFEILNPSFEKVLGYSQNELSENPFLDFVHPDDIPATLHEYGKLKSGATVIHFFNRYRKKDGSYLWFDWNASPNPLTGKLYCIARDITGRKNAEDALSKLNEELELKVSERTEAIKRSEKQYRYLFENNPMPMFVMELTNFKILDVNEIAILHYGYSREEFLSMTALDMRPDEDAALFKKLDFSFNADSVDYNKGIWKHRKKDGTIMQVEVITHEILFEGIETRLVLSNDVTEQKQAEQKLITSEKRFRALVENNYDMISLMDESFKIIYRSPSSLRITGWTDEDLNINSPENIHPDDLEKTKDIMQEMMTNPGKPVNISFRNRHKNGHYLWVEGTVINLLQDEDVKAIVFNFRDVTERIEAKEKLAASEMHFRSLIENSAEGIALTDEYANNIYRSPAAQKIMGEVSKENTTMLSHPDDLEAIKNKRAKALRNPGIPFPFEGRFLHASGHYIWLEGTLINLLQVKGVNAVVANFHDITQRKEAEEKLITNETRFRSLIENISDAIVLNDEDSNILYQSPSVTRILGYTADERKGTKVLDYIHPDNQKGFINQYKKLKESPGIPIPFQYRFRHKSGDFIWLEGVVTNLVHNPAVNAYVANYRDITQRKESEDALKKSEKIYKTIASSIPGSVICLLDTDFRYLLIEGDMLKSLGYSKDKLLGNKAGDVLLPEIFENIQNEFKKVLAGEMVTRESISNGFDIISRLIPLRDENNIVYAIMTVAIDVTELKNAQRHITKLNRGLEEKIIQRTEQLRKTNEELETFSYSVSHDLRAPLRAIIGFTDILEEEYSSKLDEEAKRITSVIKSNTLKMGHLIDDLLTFSRMGRQDMIKNNINTTELVNELIAEMDTKGNNIHAIKWIIHSLPCMKADQNTIRQVWINLISNAVKYSGKVVNQAIEIGSFNQHGQVVFFVKDNGVGFDEKYKDKLFRVFQRLHGADEFEGTGIGLAIVEKIISKHGGKVWAEAELNKSASFYFSLPADDI